MSWFTCLFRPRRPGTIRNAPRRVRPQVEILEDRLAPAGVFDVTTTVDSAAFGSGSLRAAILQADATPGPNTINVPAGTYNLTLTSNGAHDGKTGALLIQTNDLTINALGAVTIDANNIDRVFDIEGAVAIAVDFNGLTITGGGATISSDQGAFGGGIYVNNSAVLSLTDTVVSGNGADLSGGGIYTHAGALAITGGGVNGNTTPGDGGGIFTTGGNITLTNASVSNNASSTSGGGIYDAGTITNGNLSLVAAVVSGNTAGSDSHPDKGGGIADLAAGGTLFISAQSSITGNAANNTGGGVYTTVKNFTIAHSTISNNTALDGSGGGIYDKNASQTLNITNSTFASNTASANNSSPGLPLGLGGGLYASASGVTLTGDAFSANAAFSGGGVYTTGAKLSVSGGSFTGNSGNGFASSGSTVHNGQGGGLYAQNAASATLGNVTFSGNTAGYGGGAVLDIFSSVKLTGSTFSANRASLSGGGISLGEVTNATFGNLTVAGNIAGPNGGGVYFDGTNLTVANSTFTGNAANGNTGFNGGGGIYYNQLGSTSGTLNIANSTFSANSALTGGGLFISNSSIQSTLAITDSSFNYNNASFIGGGIYANQLKSDTLTNVNLIGNVAGSDDGGGYFSGTTFSMSYGNVYGNTSAFKGGFKADVATGTISHTTISGNRAATTAGGLYFITSVSGTLSDDTITNNQATLSGSGAYWELTAGIGTITNSTFSGNSGGSALSLHSGGNLTITGSTFYGNRTTFDGGAIYTTIGTLYLTNDTLYGNTSGTGGGGLFVSSGTVNLLSDTISANNANSGGGVYAFGGSTVNVDSTLIAGNTAPTAPDASGDFTDQGFNLIGKSDGSSGFTVSTLVGTIANPQAANLGPLQNNGGPTFTANLLPSSPAIGAGDKTNSPTTDQRGYPRPGQGEIKPSIGAFEYQKPLAALGSNANANFVESLYETLLGRTADAGAVYWVGLLNAGAAGNTVVQGIEGSNEFQQDTVAYLYGKFLHRLPDAGAQGWVKVLAAGGTFTQVIEGITSSPEYFYLHGGSNSAFVTALYLDDLNRAPDAAGLAYWTQALNGGASTAQVATAFATSQEYRADMVQSDYAEFLGRVADPGGLAYWLGQLNAGVSDQVVLAAILGSAEGFGNRS